jgi:hypothetical protein
MLIHMIYVNFLLIRINSYSVGLSPTALEGIPISQSESGVVSSIPWNIRIFPNHQNANLSAAYDRHQGNMTKSDQKGVNRAHWGP